MIYHESHLWVCYSIRHLGVFKCFKRMWSFLKLATVDLRWGEKEPLFHTEESVKIQKMSLFANNVNVNDCYLITDWRSLTLLRVIDNWLLVLDCLAAGWLGPGSKLMFVSKMIVPWLMYRTALLEVDGSLDEVVI